MLLLFWFAMHFEISFKFDVLFSHRNSFVEWNFSKFRSNNGSCMNFVVKKSLQLVFLWIFLVFDNRFYLYFLCAMHNEQYHGYEVHSAQNISDLKWINFYFQCAVHIKNKLNFAIAIKLHVCFLTNFVTTELYSFLFQIC